MPLIGYARVSTSAQDLDNQKTTLAAAGCERIFAEKITGAHAQRPELLRLMDYIRSGDALLVTRLDRLARNTRDLLNLVAQLQSKDAGLKSLAEPWADTTTPAGKMMLTVLVGIAEFERSLIITRTNEGRAAARKKGVKFGPKVKLDNAQIEIARAAIAGGKTIRETAHALDVHHSTLYRAINRLSVK
jgi:DNA invertase Pin-like site-specific DNA recombinase